jgi:hypothetical protein
MKNLEALNLCKSICDHFESKMSGKKPKLSLYQIWKKAEIITSCENKEIRAYFIDVTPMIEGQSRVVFMAWSRKEAKLRVPKIEKKYNVKAISNPKFATV